MNVIYTLKNCIHCENAKDFLNQKNIEFQEILVGDNGISKNDLFEKIGHEVSSVPQIFIDNKYIGGFTDLIDYFNSWNE